MEALAGVPDTYTDVGMALVMTERVDARAKETDGTKLSKLFPICRGGMTAEQTAKQ